MSEEWLWRWKHFGGWIFGALGLVLAIFSGFDLVTRVIASQDARHIAANIYLVATAGLVFLICAFRVYSSIRKERYANITRALHSVMHQARDIQTFISKQEPKGQNKKAYETFQASCDLMFGNILDQVNLIFTSLTSTHCRAGIKVLYEKHGELYVATLTRDKSARQDCFELDNKRVTRDNDPLKDNLSFAMLFSEDDKHWHYVSNNLMREKKFTSTSSRAYEPDFANTPTNGRRKWPLPYKSTIACVIRQGSFDHCRTLKPEVLGFLTIDSESRGVFAGRWDVQVMYAIADALYFPVRGYLDSMSRAKAAPD